MRTIIPARRPLAAISAALLCLALVTLLPGDLPTGRSLDAGRCPPAGSGTIDLGPPGHECRFWGMVGQGYDSRMIDDQIRGASRSTLHKLGGINRDGWAFVSFPSDTMLRRVLGGPVIRRGRPPSATPSDPNFNIAVDEVQRLVPRALLGHVRTGTSGHWGIPDPHPFLHLAYAFAHNGDVSQKICQDLIDGEDPTYLVRYPPEYVTGTIDSELLFLWFMCHREKHPELSTPEALREAAGILWPLISGARINFVMTQGDTLYALRCAGHDESDPVRYYPNDDPASPFWIAASQPMGSEESRWATIPATTLAVFVPGQAPSFYTLETSGLPIFTFRSIRVRGLDADGDGKVSRFTVAAVPDVNYGSHDVHLRVYRLGSGEPLLLGQSETLRLCAGRGDTVSAAVEVAPADRPSESWDLGVELIGTGVSPQPLAVAGAGSDPAWGLSGLAVEGSALDSGAPPDTTDPHVEQAPDRPWPNPSHLAFTIPVQTQKNVDRVRLEIRNSTGALVVSAADLPVSGNPPSVSWNGLDAHGRRVAAGTYFCRVRAGGETRDTKLTVLR
jgi:predicted glutamine amidotransferase